MNVGRFEYGEARLYQAIEMNFDLQYFTKLVTPSHPCERDIACMEAGT
ncbi:MAG: hypothetical protein ACI9LM_003829 [Alteromonadaceae bacterium]|jgi:hypothetical protein